MNQDQILQIMVASLPTMLVVLIGILINNARLGDLRSDINGRFGDINLRLNDLNSRINDLRTEMNARFDESRALWQADLRRVEEVLDTRLRHLEER